MNNGHYCSAEQTIDHCVQVFLLTLLGPMNNKKKRNKQRLLDI